MYYLIYCLILRVKGEKKVTLKMNIHRYNIPGIDAFLVRKKEEID